MSSPATDLATIRAALDGDAEAGEQLAQRLRVLPQIAAIVNARKGAPLATHDLEDLASDLIVIVWRKLEQYEGLGPLESWLYRFCELEHLNHIRSRKSRTGIPLAEIEEPSNETASAVDVEALETALTDLGPPEEVLIRLKHFEGLSFTGIGERLGLSTNTAKTGYYRGIQWLRTRLQAAREETCP